MLSFSIGWAKIRRTNSLEQCVLCICGVVPIRKIDVSPASNKSYEYATEHAVRIETWVSKVVSESRIPLQVEIKIYKK